MRHKVRICAVPLLSLCTVVAIIVLGCCLSGCRKDAKLTSLNPDATPETTTTGTIPGTASTVATAASMLSWDTPTTYTDGSSPLVLKEYKVYFSTSPNPRSTGNFYPVPPTATSVKIKDIISLGTGTYYFVVSAVDSTDNESDPSNMVSRYLY